MSSIHDIIREVLEEDSMLLEFPVESSRSQIQLPQDKIRLAKKGTIIKHTLGDRAVNVYKITGVFNRNEDYVHIDKPKRREAAHLRNHV